MDIISIKLGRRIRSLRQSRGFTQEKLAELANLNVTFVGHIERGSKNPTIETLYKISIALNIPLHELVNFDNTPLLSSTKEEQLGSILADFIKKISKLYE